jgi:hypothetical protein
LRVHCREQVRARHQQIGSVNHVALL